MKIMVLFLSISLTTIEITFACTTFVINDSTNLIFGRNSDWDISTGMIVVNKKGLVIAQMGLFDSKFPEKTDKKVVGELEWIQYQLDNASSLQDVIDNNQKVQILPVAVPVQYMIYEKSKNEIKAYEPYGGTKQIPDRWDKISDIVVSASSMIDKYDRTQSIINYGFDILNAVG